MPIAREDITRRSQRFELVKLEERKQHKKSIRNVSLEDRAPELIKIDNLIQRQLEIIWQTLYLDGTASAIEQLSNDILQLTKETEQQIRYKQVRNLLEELVS